MLKNHEKINNVNFLNIDYKKFNINKKYDIIFSFAVHLWIWLEFNDYLKTIYSKLNEWWIVIIESHINNQLNSKVVCAVT